MKIFISSTFEDLKEHRQKVRDAILRLGHHPVGMEDFGAGPTDPQTAALGKIKDCGACQFSPTVSRVLSPTLCRGE
jgi:hypothetical protein